MADTTYAMQPQAQKPGAEKEKEKKKNPFPRQKNKTKEKIPKFTENSVFTNDPLWKDSYIIDGELGFTSYPPAKEFNADAAGYVHLVESEYKAISDVDRYYTKSVSASAHAYYHHILYWYELALIGKKRGTATRDQDNLIRFVQGYSTAVIASVAGEYLEGLGDYQDAMGVKHLLTSTLPNDEGHFGRVNVHTHGFYETLPAPAIILQRIIEDVRATERNGVANEDWVPGGIQPQPRDQQVENSARAERETLIEEAGAPDSDTERGQQGSVEPDPQEDEVRARPTVNLLGWRKPEKLTANQFKLLQNRVDEDSGLICGAFKVSREIFEFVERNLRKCKRYKMTNIPSTTGGSMVQQVIWKPTVPVTSRHQQHIEAPGRAVTRSNMPVRAAVAAKVMCYRTFREEIETDEGVIYNSWACFDYGNYRQVPQNWVANRNLLLQRGLDGLIDYTPFQTEETQRSTLTEYLNKFKTPV